MASLPPALKLSKVIERSLACRHVQFSRELLPIVEKRPLETLLKKSWLFSLLQRRTDYHMDFGGNLILTEEGGSPPTHLQTSVDLHHTSILNSKQFVHLLKNHITSS
jgi:hypothetical protein